MRASLRASYLALPLLSIFDHLTPICPFCITSPDPRREPSALPGGPPALRSEAASLRSEWPDPQGKRSDPRGEASAPRSQPPALLGK